MTRLERQRLITEHLASLTPEQYAETCNGVGAKMVLYLTVFGCEIEIPLSKWLRVPERIQRILRPASDRHDVGYKLGGDELQKMYDDTDFLGFGMELVYAERSGVILRLYDRIWTYICYTLVRVCGGQFFNYKT